MKNLEMLRLENKYQSFFSRLSTRLRKFGDFIMNLDKDNQYIIEGWDFVMKQEDDQLYIFFKNKNKKFQKHIEINLELKQITVLQKITGKTQLLFFVLNEALFSQEK